MNKKVLRNLSYGVYAVSALGRIVCPAALPTVLCRLLLPLQL